MENNIINLEEYAGSSEFPVADEADYELVIKAEVKRTRDNTRDFLNIDFKIRDDVDQPFKGVHVFDKAWRDTGNPKWFDLKKLGGIVVTQKGLPGYKASFEEVDECIQYLNGLHLIAHVVKSYDDYSEKDVNSIKYLSYRPSEWDKTHPTSSIVNTAAANSAKIVEANTSNLKLADDEIPF